MHSLKRSNLHPYQVTSVEHIKQHRASMLWLDMGLGKTISTLTAAADLFNEGRRKGFLVVGPLRVIQSVWEEEAQKWEHTSHLKFETLHGNKRDMAFDLKKFAHFYLINYEGLPWLANEIRSKYLANGKLPPFDTVVFDEITRLKSARRIGEDGSKRAEYMLSIMPWIENRVGLTGTPSPNGLIDLFGQYLMIDGGTRLGTSVEVYKERFFSQGGMGWNSPKVTKLGEQGIHQAIGDITLQMKGSDYLKDLPTVVEDIVNVKLPLPLVDKYRQLELELFMELDSGATIEVVNTLALMNKCLQFANGAVYLVPGEPAWEQVHDAKLDALEEVYESHGRNPLLIAYQYKHDVARIVKRFEGRSRVVVLGSNVNAEDTREIIASWNRGEIPFLIGHPNSIGHGLNLQDGSNHVCFFGIGYNLEWMMQFIGRLERQGQKEKMVIVHKILCEDTLDYAVLESLEEKSGTQTGLRDAIEAYRKRRNL